MAPQLLFDISDIDMEQVQMDVTEVEKINPHRGDMRLLDGLTYVKDDHTEGIAYKDAGEDEFWVPGHIPGRPIFPGVLIIEVAAQLSSALRALRAQDGRFMGFVGVDNVKFRGQVAPGDRLYMLAKQVEYRPRRCVCDAQGLVNGRLVFEGRVTGMLI